MVSNGVVLALLLLAHVVALIQGSVQEVVYPVGVTKTRSTRKLSECKVVLDSPASWGHLYFDGRIETIEFFTSLFSTRFPCSTVPMTVADPQDACKRISNDIKGKAVVVSRGQCTFRQKARIVVEAGGIAMILTNGVDDTLFAMSDNEFAGESTEELDKQPHRKIASVMVRERSGILLRNHIKRFPGATVLLQGEHARDYLALDITMCGACLNHGLVNEVDKVAADAVVEALRTPISGGSFEVTGVKTELMQSGESVVLARGDFWVGNTGFSVPTEVRVPLMVPANPNNEYGCKPIELSGDAYTGEGSSPVLLLKRGGCPFIDKQYHVLNARAWAVLVENSDDVMMLPAVPPGFSDPFLPSYNNATLVASMITFKRTGEELRAVLERGQQIFIKFIPVPRMRIEDAKYGRGNLFKELHFWKKADGDNQKASLEDIEHFRRQLGLREEYMDSLRDEF